MAIVKLATATPAETEFGAGTAVHTTAVPKLCSVIITNTTPETGYVYVYTVGEGDEESPESWALIAYRLAVSGYNTYETFRFALNGGDTLYVAGSANMSYFIQGISQ